MKKSTLIAILISGGAVLSIVIIGFLLYYINTVQGQFGTDAEKYSQVGEWTIVKKPSESYCFAAINYSGDGDKMLIDLSTTSENITQGMNILVFGLDAKEYVQAQTLVVLTDKELVKDNVVSDFYSAGQGVSLFEDGVLAVIVPIDPKTEAKAFWQSLRKTNTMVITNPYGSLTLEVDDIRKALIETLECKAIKFGSGSTE